MLSVNTSLQNNFSKTQGTTDAVCVVTAMPWLRSFAILSFVKKPLIVCLCQRALHKSGTDKQKEMKLCEWSCFQFHLWSKFVLVLTCCCCENTVDCFYVAVHAGGVWLGLHYGLQAEATWGIPWREKRLLCKHRIHEKLCSNDTVTISILINDNWNLYFGICWMLKTEFWCLQLNCNLYALIPHPLFLQ